MLLRPSLKRPTARPVACDAAVIPAAEDVHREEGSRVHAAWTSSILRSFAFVIWGFTIVGVPYSERVSYYVRVYEAKGKILKLG